MSASFPDNLFAFSSFLFQCGKPQMTWFILSFFSNFNFSFFKDYNNKTSEISSSILSFFYLLRSSFFTLIFSFFKDYNKKHQRSHFLFFLSFVF